ncbi:JAB domain-containing protein [Maribacter sp. BPC-D8]|uniref:JAB domain-containing protein n=1 Tax=Maribacter sp. BPC-D8 TaxID=3053613 RepID=UPI003A5CEF2C
MKSLKLIVSNKYSGQTRFSKADIAVSKKLEIACNYFDIRFVDSIVINREKHSSMKDEGVI